MIAFKSFLSEKGGEMSKDKQRGKLINWVLQNSKLSHWSTDCDWLTKVKWIYEPSCLLAHGIVKGIKQGVKARILGRQNESNFCYDRLALTSIFCMYFMSVCLIKSNCYSLIYSSLIEPVLKHNLKDTDIRVSFFLKNILLCKKFL